jgi:eukaryotic-like serine/threonine-protein kinase
MHVSPSIARLDAALEGRYRIERELGEGGMATVYLARDERHGRYVALKVLKPELTAAVGAERFLAEIETTARLQHPHILPLFDSGEADGFLFYVMPYVEGETLQERIKREKQLPVADAVTIATAVANALETAHAAGVVHRDIKPGNILLSRGEALVADFGIALAVGSAGGSRLTESGHGIGTPCYMSPEQATGESVGPWSDTFALACVLYEMLVGEPPYTGATAQAIIGKLVQGRPVSPAVARRSIPPHVDAAIRRALETLPADRFREVGHFAKALGDPSFRHGEAAGVSVHGYRRWRAGALGASVTAMLLASLSVWGLTRSGPPPATVRLSVVLPEPQAVSHGTMALSSDGSIFVYEGPGEAGSHQLWVRHWSELNASPLPGTATGLHPSFSPDDREIAYMDRGTSQGTHNRLMVIPVTGGVPRVLHDSIRGYPHWASDGNIYYMDVTTGGISRIPGEGGLVETITERQQDDETPHYNPHYVADGEAVLFVVNTGSTAHIRSVDLASREIRTLVTNGVRPHVTSSGHLVYLTPAGDLTVAPFDAHEMRLTGVGLPLVGGIEFNLVYSQVIVSRNGTLVYGIGSSSRRYQPVWVDREGTATPVDPEWRFDPGARPGLSLSPDGTRLAVSIRGAVAQDLWIKQLPGGPLTRLTSGSVEESDPRWTRDGRVTYISVRDGPGAMYARRDDGTGSAELLLSHERQIHEGILSIDGEWLLARVGSSISVAGKAPGTDIIAQRRTRDAEPTALIATGFEETAIALSPDGRWLAYVSDETGRNEIYVRPFPDVDAAKRTVSVNGGTMPLWSRRGDAVFYLNAAREMVEVRVATDSSFAVEERRTLFHLGPEFMTLQNVAEWAQSGPLYDIAPDDERFLMLRVEEQERRELILVLNWFEELKEHIPN